MKLLNTLDGFYEPEESVPTEEERQRGSQLLSDWLKPGSKAARFLKIGVSEDKMRADTFVQATDAFNQGH